MSQKPFYAIATHPIIQAVMHELYCFADKAQAIQQLEVIRALFIPAKKQLKNEKDPSLILWIKGYEVEPGEEKQGIIGHYAIITLSKKGADHSLKLIKMPSPVRDHPQRAQIKRATPNWGHPVLRAVLRRKLYPTRAAAEAELALLHREFPMLTTPNPGKLFVMVYCADRPARARLVKHLLEVKQREDEAGFIIQCEEVVPIRPPKTEQPEPIPEGFAAKVTARRKRKK